jgi:carbon storage regulator
MLILTRRVRQCVTIGTDISVVILEIKEQQERIGIDAPRDMAVYREEIKDKVKRDDPPPTVVM